jgi:hypothetical protein
MESGDGAGAGHGLNADINFVAFINAFAAGCLGVAPQLVAPLFQAVSSPLAFMRRRSNQDIAKNGDAT